MTCTNKLNTSCPDIQSANPCQSFQLTKSNDQCVIDAYVNEALNIAGADVHVFKLLGVHEQSKLVDLTGHGVGISGGDLAGFPASNAFNVFATEWHSLQKGAGVVSSAYIGYDFGAIKLENGRDRYGIDTSIKYKIATIKIKQSTNAANRVTRMRVERSFNGSEWYGVAIIDLPDDAALNTIYFKSSTHARYWRLRPVIFSGSVTDYWGIQALQFSEHDATALNNIQDPIFLENRDRDYAPEIVTLKGFYSLLDTQIELTRFGIELPSQQYVFQIGFTSCVALLGRPMVIGDIIELPSETQYDANMKPVRKYLEVTDVGWSTEGYTPGWVPTMLRVITQPMLASQETQDIVGDLAAKIDSSGLFNTDDGTNTIYQDMSSISQEIAQEANSQLPERGADGTGTIRAFEDAEIASAAQQGIDIQKLGLNKTGLYVEDAMPPNGLPYTEGDSFPTAPSDGDYHRLTYVGAASDISPRLHRYSAAKGRWVYLETDRRKQYNNTKPILQEFLSSPKRIPANKIK
jgi:hypothetical protein